MQSHAWLDAGQTSSPSLLLLLLLSSLTFAPSWLPSSDLLTPPLTGDCLSPAPASWHSRLLLLLLLLLPLPHSMHAISLALQRFPVTELLLELLLRLHAMSDGETFASESGTQTSAPGTCSCARCCGCCGAGCVEGSCSTPVTLPAASLSFPAGCCSAATGAAVVGATSVALQYLMDPNGLRSAPHSMHPFKPASSIVSSSSSASSVL
mmetsp:Transcript_25266/g.68678  ORF Transcript_25266/g.68678 Transcript_25266/m.68678 type:complete len:208 (+) Transcript_25266:78-701(+)